jgi:hypothetical protein
LRGFRIHKPGVPGGDRIGAASFIMTIERRVRRRLRRDVEKMAGSIPGKLTSRRLAAAIYRG